MDSLREAELGEMPAPPTTEDQTATQNLPAARTDDVAGGVTPGVTHPMDRFLVELRSSLLGLKRLINFSGPKLHDGPFLEPDVNDLRGLPSIARKHTRYHNTAMYPKYDEITHRILLDHQMKIGALRQMLQEDDSKYQKSDTSGMDFTFDKEWLVPPCPLSNVTQDQTECTRTYEECDMVNCLAHDRRDRILKVLSSRIKDFCMNQCSHIHPRLKVLTWRRADDLIDVYVRMNGRVKVDHLNYENHRKLIESEFPPDSQAWQALFAEDDEFIATRTSHGPFERLTLFVKLFPWKGEAVEGSDALYIDTDDLIAFKRLLVGFSWCIMLLVPVVILFLVTSSSAASLAVVVIFPSFLVMMMCRSGVDLDGVMLSSCAYIAVLVVFLANLH
ncbi:hypothetical protein TruAng_006023 [Truncatella angustata]|nr:hypothetical protein TruAng_006023 [Truncatella angustata]